MEVLLIGEDGRNLGSMDLESARKIAVDLNRDIIKVGKGPEMIYKIVDAGKIKYEQNKKRCGIKKKQKIKEIQIRPCTGMHDLGIKADKVLGFLKKNMNVKVVMKLRGAERAHKSVAIIKLQEFVGSIASRIDNVKYDTISSNGSNLLTMIKPVQ